MKPKSGKLIPRSFSAESATAEADCGASGLFSPEVGAAGFELQATMNITAPSSKSPNTVKNWLRFAGLSRLAWRSVLVVSFRCRFIDSLLARSGNWVDGEPGREFKPDPGF